jgi:hypothetical protein
MLPARQPHFAGTHCRNKRFGAVVSNVICHDATSTVELKQNVATRRTANRDAPAAFAASPTGPGSFATIGNGLVAAEAALACLLCRRHEG